MRVGWLASFGVHAALLAAATLVLRAAVKELPAPVDIVPVEAVIGDVSNITPIASLAPNELNFQPETQGAPPEAGLEKIPEFDKILLLKPPPPPPKKATQDKLNLDDLSKLLDRSAKEPGQRQAQSSSPTAPVGDKPRRAVGAGTALTAVAEAKVRALLVEKMKRCWRASDDARDPERLKVSVQFRLDKSGALVGQPIVRTPIALGDRELLVAAERAKSAVRACAPYDDLPADLYEIWEDVTLNFRPTGVE